MFNAEDKLTEKFVSTNTHLKVVVKCVVFSVGCWVCSGKTVL